MLISFAHKTLADSDDPPPPPPRARIANRPPVSAPAARPAPVPPARARPPASAAAPSARAAQGVQCECGVDALELTSQREQSKGRQFYKCGNDTCGFFSWADAVQASGGGQPVAGPSRTPRQTTGTRAGTGTTQCKCGESAVQREVMKDGVNKGRLFWVCVKPQDQQCGFFEWADEAGAAGGGGGGGGATGGGGSGAGEQACFKVIIVSCFRKNCFL